MQRLFTMFPARGPGAGLLLLRLAVAATTALQPAHTIGLPPWLAPACALLLTAGWFTPVLAAASTASWLVVLALAPAVDPLLVPVVLHTVALALLGPGAYSIDAWHYGRRRLVTGRGIARRE